MIFPYLRGLWQPFAAAPATYFLVCVNIFVFLFVMTEMDKSDHEMRRQIENTRMAQTQGLLFAQIVQAEPKKFSDIFVSAAKAALEGDDEAIETLSSLARKNDTFIDQAETFEFKGDDVAISEWRDWFAETDQMYKNHPSYRWGLSSTHHKISNWFSYMFAHGSVGHIFFNMLALLIFGFFIEHMMGGSVVILGYVLSGLAAAFFYRFFPGLSASPLIGASGAVAGLIGFVAATHWMRHVRYFYFVLFLKDYCGFINLPGWTLLFFLLLPDLGGALSGLAEFELVAHTAHLGGALFGIFLGFAALRGWIVDDREEDVANIGRGFL